MKRKIKNICPFCGRIIERPFETLNGFCSCGAKYYFRERIWLNRNTGEEIKDNTLVIPETGIGDVSDGYHTFNELYHHRAILFSVICNLMADKAWKSKQHNTGDMYDGMFIVGIETPQGQATYHYNIEPYWDLFKVKELEKAPEWDGHSSQEAIERIITLQK